MARWRGEPFVLEGALDDWASFPAWNRSARAAAAGGVEARPPHRARWARAALAALGEAAVCDFYPHNMLSGARVNP